MTRDDSGSSAEFHGSPYVEIPDEHWTGTVKEMRARADRTLRGFKAANHPKLGSVQFSKTGRKETLHDKTTPHQFQAVQAIPQLIEKGELTDSSPDRQHRPHITAFHTIEHGLKIGETPYHAKIIVREVKTGGGGAKTTHQFYLHRIADSKRPAVLIPAFPLRVKLEVLPAIRNLALEPNLSTPMNQIFQLLKGRYSGSRGAQWINNHPAFLHPSH
jgi:hypothetical protein